MRHGRKKRKSPSSARRSRNRLLLWQERRDSSRLQPEIRAAVTEIVRTRAEESFDRQYQSEVLVTEVLAAVKLRLSRLLSQSLEDSPSQNQAETIRSEVLEAVRPIVSRAVSTQLRSLKESVLSQAASQSEVSSYVSQVSEALQARVRTAVGGAVRSQAEKISDLVLTGLRPNILTLISAAVTSTEGIEEILMEFSILHLSREEPRCEALAWVTAGTPGRPEVLREELRGEEVLYSGESLSGGGGRL